MSKIAAFNLTAEQVGKVCAYIEGLKRENGMGEPPFIFDEGDGSEFESNVFYGWLMESEPYNNPETRRYKMWRLVVDTEKEIFRLGLSDREITELLRCIERYHKELRPEKS